MTAPFAACGLAHRLTVQPFAPGLAMVSIALPSRRMTGLRASRDASGRVRIEAPSANAAHSLQPAFRELIADAVADLWPSADAGGGAR